jgi:hypothetical protein
MSELTSCIQAVEGLMSKSSWTDGMQLRKQIIRLFEEGVDMKTIIDALIARAHEKEEEVILQGLSPSSKYLSNDDLTTVERALGINDPTPENRAAWEMKFKEGRARYWCPNPECGYSGNDEFRDGRATGTGLMQCPQCGRLVDDMRYLTRKWTPEEQAAFEAERNARVAEWEAKRAAEGELKRQRDAQIASVRSDAVKATREIELHQWLLNGDDEDAFSWDEHDAERKIRTVIALMLRPLNFGRLPIPADDVVAYFKQTMKDSDDDLQAANKEFNRCAQSFDKMTIETMEETDNE